MERLFHIAANYIAAGQKAVLKEKADHSHTNMTWNEAMFGLLGRELKFGTHLYFNYHTLHLELLSKSRTSLETINLEKAEHLDVIHWLEESLQKHVESNANVVWQFDYELSFLENPKWENIDEKSRISHTEMRTAAQRFIESIKNELSNTTEIAIWPHHFDQGFLKIVEKENDSASKTIGIGFAVPDGLCSDYYIYVNSWSKDGDKVDVDKFSQPEYGKWRSGQFNGLVIPFGNYESEDYFDSVMSAINQIEEAMSPVKA